MTVSEELQQLIDNPATDDAARDTMQRALHAMKAMADQIGRQQEMAGKYARKVNQHNEAALTALIGLNHMLRMEAPENFQSDEVEAAARAVMATGGKPQFITSLITGLQASMELK